MPKTILFHHNKAIYENPTNIIFNGKKKKKLKDFPLNLA